MEFDDAMHCTRPSRVRVPTVEHKAAFKSASLVRKINAKRRTRRRHRGRDTKLTDQKIEHHSFAATTPPAGAVAGSSPVSSTTVASSDHPISNVEETATHTRRMDEWDVVFVSPRDREAPSLFTLRAWWPRWLWRW